jgi:hypothetical protein
VFFDRSGASAVDAVVVGDAVTVTETTNAAVGVPPRWRRVVEARLRRSRRVPLWVDVMACSRCDGPRKVMTFLAEPTVVTGLLTHLGLPADPLPAVNAQAPPTAEMFDDP